MCIFCRGNAQWRQTVQIVFEYLPPFCTLSYNKHDYSICITKGANCNMNWCKRMKVCEKKKTEMCLSIAGNTYISSLLNWTWTAQVYFPTKIAWILISLSSSQDLHESYFVIHNNKPTAMISSERHHRGKKIKCNLIEPSDTCMAEFP